jgi:hypothetical protein
MARLSKTTVGFQGEAQGFVKLRRQIGAWGYPFRLGILDCGLKDFKNENSETGIRYPEPGIQNPKSSSMFPATMTQALGRSLLTWTRAFVTFMI